MFYNHEILTSRKYGIATIWLVATLGSKSNLRKINRKAIFDVDIAKACDTITEPDVPMALRLQSNLLFGVTRVYDQQCTFVLTELQSLQHNMTQAMRTIMRKELDLEVGRSVRPEQLLLQDDPSFLPDFAFDNLALDANLEVPGLDHDTSPESTLLSPSTPRDDSSGHGGFSQLRIPSSGSGGQAGFPYSEGRFSDLARGALGQMADEPAFFPEPDFIFDDTGMIHEVEPAKSASRPPSLARETLPSAQRIQSRAGSDSSALAHVRREHEEARRAATDFGQPMDIDYGAMAGDQFDIPIDAEPFSQGQQPAATAPSNILRSSAVEHDGREEHTSETAEAPQRRTTRRPRTIKLDESTQIPNQVIASWNADYLDNMAKESAQKANHRAPHLAKKNAEYWVWTMGIAGIGTHLSGLNIPSPLDIFHGDKLFEAVTGITATGPSRKRSHASASTDSADEEGRRVRARGEGDTEVARADGQPPLDDEGFQLAEEEQDLEVGRGAPTPIRDASSLMPWNMSASQRSSNPPGSVPYPRGAHRLSRAASLSIATPLPTGYTGHRLTSASPLPHHGGAVHSRQRSLAPQGGLLPPSSSIAGGDFDPPAPAAGPGPTDDTLGALNQQEEFELFGPAAAVDTQTAAQSQWLRTALDAESDNFLAFVDSAIADRKQQRQQRDATIEEEEDEEDSPSGGNNDDEITFHALLDPGTNSAVVAAQGLLHCLALATRGRLVCRQEEGFGEIWLGLP